MQTVIDIPLKFQLLLGYCLAISGKTKYTENGNFVSKSIDERGNETSYNYNETKGTLTDVTNANVTQGDGSSVYD